MAWVVMEVTERSCWLLSHQELGIGVVIRSTSGIHVPRCCQCYDDNHSSQRQPAHDLILRLATREHMCCAAPSEAATGFGSKLSVRRMGVRGRETAHD